MHRTDLEALYDRATQLQRTGQPHAALSLLVQCVRSTKDFSLFFPALTSLTESIIGFGQVFAAYSIASWAERLGQRLAEDGEIESTLKEVLSVNRKKIHSLYARQINDRRAQVEDIVNSLFKLQGRTDIVDSLYYFSTTLEYDRPSQPLFHSFRLTIPLLDRTGAIVTSFEPYFHVFEFDGPVSIKPSFLALYDQVEQNCGFGPTETCFARGARKEIGLILSFEPSHEEQFFYFLAGLLPPYALPRRILSRKPEDFTPAAHGCVTLGIEAEKCSEINRALAWYGVGAAAGSASGDLNSALTALVHFVRVNRKTGDVVTAEKALSDIHAGLDRMDLPRVSNLIERGFLNELDELNVKEMSNILSGLFAAPSSEEEPKGSSSGSNKREYWVLVDLYEGWLKEFPEEIVPLSKPVVLAPISATGDGLLFTEYRDRLGGRRLSTYEHLDDLIATSSIDAAKFATNVFGTIRVAHKLLMGSFSSDAGSGLSASNLTLDGEIKDLETFHSPRYGDPLVPEEYFVEDIRRATEALKELCTKLKQDSASRRVEFRTALQKGIETYAGVSESGSLVSDELMRELFGGRPLIPSANAPVGQKLLDFARLLYSIATKEEGWNRESK